ncbi:MAG: hypothetical protein Fur0022_42390 [Anaerolineales bacterium]
MLRKNLKKHGAIRLTLAITLISILISMGITILASWLITQEFVGWFGLFISILVPAILAPSFSSVQLLLLSELYRTQEELRKQAITDDLTQVYNRRYFIELAQEVLAHVRQQGGKFSIIILDMDNFKEINDTYGHGTGDQMLRRFTEICQVFLPETAILARYGGDEFVFLLQDADLTEANQCADKLRGALAQTYLQIGQEKITLKASLGSATYQPHILDLDVLLAQADQAMYAEKRQKGEPSHLAAP